MIVVVIIIIIIRSASKHRHACFRHAVAAVPPSGNCCQRYYHFRFGFFVFVLVFVNDNHTGSDGMSHGALILNQSIINRSFSSCVTFIRANKSGDDVGRSAACRLPEIRSRATDRRWRRLAVTRLTTCRNNSAAVVDYETSMTLGSHGSRTLGRDRSRSARWELYKFPTSRRPIFTAVVCLICCAVTMSR